MKEKLGKDGGGGGGGEEGGRQTFIYGKRDRQTCDGNHCLLCVLFVRGRERGGRKRRGRETFERISGKEIERARDRQTDRCRDSGNGSKMSSAGIQLINMGIGTRGDRRRCRERGGGGR